MFLTKKNKIIISTENHCEDEAKQKKTLLVEQSSVSRQNSS